MAKEWTVEKGGIRVVQKRKKQEYRIYSKRCSKSGAIGGMEQKQSK